MLNLRKILRNYRETGSLAEHCSIYGFINEQCFITKTGDVGVALRFEGIDYECLDQHAIDNNTKRLEAAFKLFGPDFRVYQYLFKSRFEPAAPPEYSDPVVQTAEHERYRYFAGRSDELFTIQTYYVILYRPETTKPKGNPFSAKKQIVFIQEQIERAQATLMRQIHSFI